MEINKHVEYNEVRSNELVYLIFVYLGVCMLPRFNSFVQWDHLEAVYVIGVLMWNNGNRTTTAKLLGYSLRTFRSRLRRWETEGYRIPDPPNARTCWPKDKRRYELKRKKKIKDDILKIFSDKAVEGDVVSKLINSLVNYVHNEVEGNRQKVFDMSEHNRIHQRSADGKVQIVQCGSR